MAGKGRPKLIESPEKLWEMFEGYRRSIKENPKEKNDFAGKDAFEVIRKLERPLIMEGFEEYVYDQGFNTELSNYFSNRDAAYTEFSAICSRIRRAIRADQIEGGMCGVFNASITQRINGLTEKTDNKNENTNKNFDLTMNI